MKRIGVFLRKTNTLVLCQRSYVTLMDSFIQSSPALRTPALYGHLCINCYRTVCFVHGEMKKALIYSKFKPFNTDTFHGPLRVCINGFSLQCIWRPNLFLFFFSRCCVQASPNVFSGIFPRCKFKCYISLVFFFFAFCHVIKKRTRTISKKMYILSCL